MNTHWFPLTNRLDSLTQVSRELRGVRCKVSLSPYDIPQAVRGYMDKNIFVVELKYLSDEPLKEQALEGLTLDVGVNSGRIYKLKFPADIIVQRGVENFFHNLVEAINVLSMPPKTDRLLDQYDLTKNCLLNSRDALFGRFDRTNEFPEAKTPVFFQKSPFESENSS